MSDPRFNGALCWGCNKRPAVMFLKREIGEFAEVIPTCSICDHRKLQITNVYTLIDLNEGFELFEVQQVLFE